MDLKKNALKENMPADEPIGVIVKLFKYTPPSEKTYDLWDNNVELDVFAMLDLEKCQIIDMPIIDGSGGVGKLCLCNHKDLLPAMDNNLPHIFHKYRDLVFQIEALFQDDHIETSAYKARAKHKLIEEQLDSKDDKHVAVDDAF